MLLANALLGNEPGATVIELSNAEIEVVFSSSTRLAVTGAPSDHANSSFDVAASRSVKIGAPRMGLRIYIAVKNGWLPEGIESDIARTGRRLTAGEVLEYGELVPSRHNQRLEKEPGSLQGGPIRVLKGPQPVLAVSRSFTVSNQSDRTGIRLDGLSPLSFRELTSEPACVGAIQVTPSGQLIVIGPDGPTIGGYPKVAVVCSADLDRLAQLRPGQEVRFEYIDIEVAQQLNAERQARMQRVISQLNLLRK
jgi:allophanate hydrolase subunit 2